MSGDQIYLVHLKRDNLHERNDMVRESHTVIAEKKAKQELIAETKKSGEMNFQIYSLGAGLSAGIKNNS